MQTAGQNATLVNETYLANKRQLELFLGRAEKEAKFDWTGKIVALLGLAFKQGTNDTRNSPSIDIVHFLLEKQVGEIRCYDPAAIEWFEKIFTESKQIKYFKSENEAVSGAQAVIIATDWPQFRGLGDLLVRSKNKPLIMDGRRMLAHQYHELQKSGFDVIAVGSQSIFKK